ncbi:PAS domain S-box protein [Rhizobium sp. 60-20]|uniref:PAS domain S-box protein n=1 Tax=Rhizobium sp. 60-20 TaxID=1895819 RepID=UPI00092AD1F1|nr:MAG: histidine kinase [Rhizobium sp. 60-20]
MSVSSGEGQSRFAQGRLADPKSVGKPVQPEHDAAAFLAAIVESSEDAIVSKSLSGIITTWNKGAERLFGYTAEEAIGQPITIVIPDDRLDEEPAILARIRAGERVDHFATVRRHKDGSLIDISLTISPIRDGSGQVVGASKIARNISERKRAAEHQELLLREMHHRVKNLFAITSGLIGLAARSAQTPADLATRMRDRLMSLSRAHEMTLPALGHEDRVGDRQATLFQLLSNILAPYCQEGSDQWQLYGRDVEISREKITNLALLFHEFATNAAKYGALSIEDGKLSITVTIEEEAVNIVWLESNFPPQDGAERGATGFGARLEQMMGQSLNLNITREWLPDGLCIRLSAPFEAIGR